MEQTDIDKKIAEIEGNLSVWGNRTEVKWLLDQLKACREERGLPPKIEDLSHTIEFEDVDEQD